MLAPRADVEVALLFGSVARDRATDDSDIDVAVLAPGVDRLALAGDLSRALGFDVDVVDLHDATIPLLAAVVRDGIPVHQNARGAEGAWRARTISEESARAMSNAVGLRNVVAHGYGTVDVAMLHAASVPGASDLERVVSEIAAWVHGRRLVSG